MILPKSFKTVFISIFYWTSCLDSISFFIELHYKSFNWKHWFAGLSCFFVEYQYFIGEMWSTYWKKDKQKLKYLIEMYGKSCFSVGIISRYTVLEVQFDICEEIDKKLLVHCFFLNISKFRKVWQMAHMGISKSYLPSEVTL